MSAPRRPLTCARPVSPDRDAVALRVARQLGGELLDEVRALRSRPDEGHVATQDVPQLRQFVERGAPQDPADRADALVADDRPLRGRLALVGGPHRPELQALEELPVPADARLTKDHAGTPLEAHRQRAHAHHRSEQDENDRADDHVEDPLERPAHAVELGCPNAHDRDRADVVAVAGLRHEGGQARNDQQVAAGAPGAAHAIEQIGLVELAAGHEHDVDTVLGNEALEVGEGAEVGGERGGGGTAAVVQEARDRESVAGMTVEQLDDIGGQAAATDHERPVGDDPAPARGEDEPARRHASERHQTEARQDDEQEGLDALAIVSQGEDRGDQRRGHEQAAEDGGELVEHGQVQTRPVAPPTGEQGERDDGHRQHGLGVLRHPEDRRHEEDSVHGKHEHPRLPGHRRAEPEQRASRAGQVGHVEPIASARTRTTGRASVPRTVPRSAVVVSDHVTPTTAPKCLTSLAAHGKAGDRRDRRYSPNRVTST